MGMAKTQIKKENILSEFGEWCWNCEGKGLTGKGYKAKSCPRCNGFGVKITGPCIGKMIEEIKHLRNVIEQINGRKE